MQGPNEIYLYHHVDNRLVVSQEATDLNVNHSDRDLGVPLSISPIVPDVYATFKIILFSLTSISHRINSYNRPIREKCTLFIHLVNVFLNKLRKLPFSLPQ